MARGDRAARRAGAGAQREADRRARGRGGVRPGSGAGRGHRQRSRDGAAARAALLCGCRGADVSRRRGRAAGSGARGTERPGAPAPRARQPRPLPRGASAGHRVHRRRHWSRRLRPRLPVDADPQRGRPGGGPRPARRTCLAGAGFQHPARGGSASALAGARVRCRAARPPDGRELHERRGDRDGSRARHSRGRTDPDPRLAGERRVGAIDGTRPAPRAGRPGPGGWTDASGRHEMAVAASFVAEPRGRRDRGPA